MIVVKYLNTYMREREKKKNTDREVNMLLRALIKFQVPDSEMSAEMPKICCGYLLFFNCK